MDVRETAAVSGWWYVALGLIIGIAIGLSLEGALEERAEAIEEGGPSEEEKPGLARKVVAKIPTRVKVGAGVGAVKGAGGAAYRMAKERMKGEN